jgi:arabinose-5-phosphate isomerase
MTKVTGIDLALAKKVLHTEAAAIEALIDRLDERFEQAIRTLLDCRGRVLVTGMGKSGIICRKIAATLSSTGTPAFFLHPADAQHGDFGVLQAEDVIIALSNTGETDEILRLLETIKRIGARLIAITGDPASSLAGAADVALDCHVSEEACPMNLAPTASTTAALALGDALAMTLLVAKGFREEDFANLHPGGKLGKRLMRVERLMHEGDVPIVTTQTPMADAMREMSRGGMGMTCVVDGDNRLAGIITDGDLRRRMIEAQNDPSGRPFLERPAGDVMSSNPATVTGSTLAVEALRMLEDRKITSLVVTDTAHRIAGILHLHDLWRTNFV